MQMFFKNLDLTDVKVCFNAMLILFTKLRRFYSSVVWPLAEKVCAPLHYNVFHSQPSSVADTSIRIPGTALGWACLHQGQATPNIPNMIKI